MAEPAPEWLAEVFPDVKAIESYVDILLSRGTDWGLLGPREPERIWSRHVINSVAGADLIPVGASVCDVGSGAGLPGIPLAIARSDLQVTLVESLLRRSEFLTLAITELGLTDRVFVVRSRAEDLNQKFDVVTARAVAPLERLLRWTAPLFTPIGQLLALKGESASQEVTEAGDQLRRLKLRAEVLQVRAHSAADVTQIVRVQCA